MNRAETFRQIGRIIKAACPSGTGYAAVIDRHFMTSAEPLDAARALAEWLERRPRVALAASAVHAGPAGGESIGAFARRQILELQCVTIAQSVADTFATYARPVTLAFFLFELGGPGSLMAYKIIGSEPLALGWVAQIAQLARVN